MARSRPAGACGMVAHARYLIWLTRAVRASNDAWLRARPDHGGEAVSREGLSSRLYHWALASGRWPEGEAPMSPTLAVAVLFKEDPDGVKAEARRYWAEKVRELTP